MTPHHSNKAVNIFLSIIEIMIEKEINSLKNCDIHKPKNKWIQVKEMRCHHIVYVDNLKLIYSPQMDEEYWDEKQINKIKNWLINNIKGNYKFIIVPTDQALKKNRILFSRIDDAMAFKLRWL